MSQPVSPEESLAAVRPDLAAQWSTDRNRDLRPEDVRPTSDRQVWWRCDRWRSHQWPEAIRTRAETGDGCPVCRVKAARKKVRLPMRATYDPRGFWRVSAERSLAVLRPDLAAEWHLLKNGDLTPDQVAPASSGIFWWRCKRHPLHEWQAMPRRRTGPRAGGCPVCAGKVVSRVNSLRHVHPDLAAEWHPYKNGQFTPDNVSDRMSERFWWTCSKDGEHEWIAPIPARVEDASCPHCTPHAYHSTLRARFPVIAAEWHPTKNGTLTPDDVKSAVALKVWWQCAKDPDHVWRAVVGTRTSGGSGCPFCAGRPHVVRPLPLRYSLLITHPALALEWDSVKNGTLAPSDVPPNVSRRVWWRCLVNPAHEWEAEVRERAHGAGCPRCARLAKQAARERDR